jgi:hypothetical protein
VRRRPPGLADEELRQEAAEAVTRARSPQDCGGQAPARRHSPESPSVGAGRRLAARTRLGPSRAGSADHVVAHARHGEEVSGSTTSRWRQTAAGAHYNFRLTRSGDGLHAWPEARIGHGAAGTAFARTGDPVNQFPVRSSHRLGRSSRTGRPRWVRSAARRSH